MQLLLDNLKKLGEESRTTTLGKLLQDEQRVSSLILNEQGMIVDFSRQFITKDSISIMTKLGEMIKPKVEAMFNGEHINTTEDRAVLHVALRSNSTDSYFVDGRNVVPDVLQVQKEVREFSEKIRNGTYVGVTGKPLTNVLAIGIGGSYLGAKFVYEALRHEKSLAHPQSEGRVLRFLANVDPVDFSRATEGLDPATTLVLVLSKTFTTAETMLNANLAKQWLIQSLSSNTIDAAAITAAHMAAVSTALPLVKAFGIDASRTFAFWDWAGGRYSVCSAVGLLPLSLQFGWNVAQQFLEGARSMDVHFRTTPGHRNLPMLLGFIGILNSTLLGYPARALAPYAECLIDFANHIQQVDMESNGKNVHTDGSKLEHTVGEIDFGQPGTNAQHSYFQLFHQGRVVPVDFIGSIESQWPRHVESTTQNCHDELMANFFAQPDALAAGQSYSELISKGVNSNLAKHKEMPGNRPSTVILLQKITAFEVGQLLSLYEHRTAVQGFVWNINSFDQYGVELGKVLATKVRQATNTVRENPSDNELQSRTLSSFNPATRVLLQAYLKQKSKL